MEHLRKKRPKRQCRRIDGVVSLAEQGVFFFERLFYFVFTEDF